MKYINPKYEVKEMQLGYRCYLKITEREIIQKLLKREIKRLKRRSRKKQLAKIYSKMEHLFPDEVKE